MTYFTNGLDPAPRSRQVFNFPRLETLAEWVAQESPLRARVRQLPELDEARLWKVQVRAIRNLEASFARADQRALIQMATGSGKTFTAVNIAYLLLKFGGAKRVLFLVDRGNLARQATDGSSKHRRKHFRHNDLRAHCVVWFAPAYILYLDENHGSRE